MTQAGTRLGIGVDLVLFGVTVVMAVHSRWSTTDLVWGLWISSLTVGYSLIVTSIVGSLVHGNASTLLGRKPGVTTTAAAPGQVPMGFAVLPLNVFILVVCFMTLGFSRLVGVLLLVVVGSSVLAIGGAVRKRPGWDFFPDPDRGLARLVIMLPGALFMLGFFTFHFGMFHFVHGLFLNGFFPLVREAPFGKTPGQVFGIVGACAAEALVRYWPLVAASALSRVPMYAAAFRTTDGSMLFKPYLNVIRMHVMIFVFALLGGAGLQSYALYPLLAVYFLPAGDLLSLLRARRTSAVPGAPTEPS